MKVILEINCRLALKTKDMMREFTSEHETFMSTHSLFISLSVHQISHLGMSCEAKASMHPKDTN